MRKNTFKEKIINQYLTNQCNAERFFASTALILAPQFNNVCAALERPNSQAFRNGVMPNLSTKSMESPALTRNSIAVTWPYIAAACKALIKNKIKLVHIFHR